MKILFDIMPLTTTVTGIGRVVINYLKYLSKVDKKNTYILYSLHPIDLQFKDFINKLGNNFIYEGGYFLNNNSCIKDTKFSIKKFFLKFFFKIAKLIFLKLVSLNISIINKLLIILIVIFFYRENNKLDKKDVDIIIITSPNFPLKLNLSTKKMIVIVYDLVWKYYPETMDILNKFIINNIALDLIKKADKIITISESVKKELTENLELKEEIIPIHLGVDKNIFYNAEKDKIEITKLKYNIKGKYLLSVSTLEPRKNLITLLKAFSMLIKKYPEYLLVLTGRIGWGNDNYEKLIKQLNIEKNVIFTGYIPDEDLAPLYSGAEVFVYPSLYEGFGLPILEAMQCKTAVITSNTSSMPEVGGDACIYVNNPRDENELLEKIIFLIENENIREELREKGIKRGSHFSWEKTAQELIKVINSFKI